MERQRREHFSLKQENSSHGSEAESTIDSAESSGSASLVAAATLLGASVTLTSGVDELAFALVATLDELLGLEGLVESAGRGDVVS
mgnify:CR=1 FL=1